MREEATSFMWWASSAARWFGHSLSYLTPSQLLSRRPDFSISSYLVVPRWWNPRSILHLPATILNLSIVDSVFWSLVTALESVALVSMLCSFYLLCGCTL